jgi:hypothetical protein
LIVWVACCQWALLKSLFGFGLIDGKEAHGGSTQGEMKRDENCLQ